ncbi:MAG: PKD domain-containing protein [Cyclobacteriaceae bacterium]
MKQTILKMNLPALTLLLSLSLLMSCGEDDGPDTPPEAPEVTAIFSVSVSGTTVTFQNASVNADTYAWDFGDGVGTSSEENPVYEYAEAGTYDVTLTASNTDNSNQATESVTIESTIALAITGKTWIPVRGEALALILGDQATVDGWDYTSTVGTWFSWGDLDGASVPLGARMAVANDEYTFNTDGTYNVDFNGDFYGEFGIWAGTEFDNASIDISSESLPLNTNGNDVSAFVTGSWNWSVDEDARTLTVSGAGAHIINPRYKNDQSSYEAGDGITYNVVKTAQGTEADTLVIYVETLDNDFGTNPRQYYVLASYHGTVPDIEEVEVIEPTPTQYEISINSGDVNHTFLSETGISSSLHAFTPYDIDFNASIGGESCTQMSKDATEQDRFGNYLFYAGVDADNRAEIDLADGNTKVSLDAYMPSTNDYSGEFKNCNYSGGYKLLI